LAIPVANYLDSGLPSQDYTQSARVFIKSKQGDINVGAMFNNFRAHPLEKHVLGVWVINMRSEGEYKHHKFWNFCALHFGGRPSPYLACQSQRIILELCKGDRHDSNNYWQWDTMRLNLLGSKDYNPLMPSVMLLWEDRKLATRKAHYVNNIHPCIHERDGSSEACHPTCAQLKLKMNA
jgi:hypothetical protein